jgi:hypothetical protein
MKLNELIMDLQRLSEILGDAEVTIMVNNQETEPEIAVLDNNRVVLVSERDASFIPDSSF